MDVLPPEHLGAVTWADFVALGEDDLRELIDGRLVKVEVPTKKHEWIVARLIAFLMAWRCQEVRERSLARATRSASMTIEA